MARRQLFGDRSLSLRQRGDDGKWELTFPYNGMTFAVVINHSYIDEEVESTVECWIDGERYRYETKSARQERHRLMQEHNDFDHRIDPDEGYVTWPSFEADIEERIEEALRRWDAICMMVKPGVSV